MITNLTHHHRLPVGDCDVCILGTGPAGITLALELSRRRPDWQIVLAEAGNMDGPSPDSTDAYKPAGDPAPYPLRATRLAWLGGTSNHWGGWCRPLDEIDFAQRPWFPHSGWPLQRDQLMPWYQQAKTWCELDSSHYDPKPYVSGHADHYLALSDDGPLQHSLFRFSPPTRFGNRYRKDLEKADNIACWLNTSAVGLDKKNGRVRAVHLANAKGLKARLQARRVIVAMGGVENARFLLTQRPDAAPESGLASPMLGRCFADHLGFSPAFALLPAELEYVRRSSDSGPLMPVLATTGAAQQAHELGNDAIMPIAVPDQGKLPAQYATNPLLGFQADTAWRYRLQFIMEPQPNPDSRITLAEETDTLGVPRLRLDWQMHADDVARGKRLVDLLVEQFAAAGMGRVKRRPPKQAFDRVPTFPCHHMGTTRMAEDNRAGVVDADGRIHGMHNLYVAGSSVFPTFGFSNPTLTIVALAVRMAAQLAGPARGES